MTQDRAPCMWQPRKPTSLQVDAGIEPSALWMVRCFFLVEGTLGGRQGVALPASERPPAQEALFCRPRLLACLHQATSSPPFTLVEPASPWQLCSKLGQSCVVAALGGQCSLGAVPWVQPPALLCFMLPVSSQLTPQPPQGCQPCFPPPCITWKEPKALPPPCWLLQQPVSRCPGFARLLGCWWGRHQSVSWQQLALALLGF